MTGDAVRRTGYPGRPPFYHYPGYYYPGHYYYPGSYWNSYYWYPYGFGAWGLGWYAYDPWWGGWAGWGAPGPYYGYGGSYGYSYNDDSGGVRLKMKPRDAQVYVDGGYVGTIDEFDGTFQRLRLDTGTHKIEVRKEGLAPLTFEVNVTPDHTITLRGELQPAVQ
jgi:hypothetical protein